MSRPKVSFRFEGLLNRPWKRNESLLWKNSTFFRGNDSFLPGLLPRESLKSQQKCRCRSCHATEASKRKRKLICWWDLFGRLISNNSQSSISDTVRTLGSLNLESILVQQWPIKNTKKTFFATRPKNFATTSFIFQDFFYCIFELHYDQWRMQQEK